MMAFVFQPQHIVANPHALFYRADTYEHREKLKTIFPYVLGAITPELLAKRYRLDQLRRELRRKEKELRAVQRVSERWLADLRSWAVQARELGLISASIGGNANREELLDLLRGIVVAASPSDAAPSPKAIEETATEAVALQHQETEASRNLSSLSRRLAEIKKLRESLNEYRDSLVIQRERLGLSDWLKQRSDSEQACVLCGGTYEVSKRRLDELCSLLHGIEEESGELKEVPAAIDREYTRVMQEVSQQTEQLSAIRQRKKALTESSAAKTRRFEAANVARFVGNVEQALKTHEELSSDSLLTREVEELQKIVEQLEREVRESAVEGRRRRALTRITKDVGALLPDLDAERPEDPVALSIEDLTIKVEGREREDFLWEIGSGQTGSHTTSL